AGPAGVGAREATPAVLVESMAVAQGDLGQGDDVLLHARAVDVLICLLPRLQWEYRIVLVGKQLRSVIPRQSDAVSLVSLRSPVHLGHRCVAKPDADHQGKTRYKCPPRY